jgi:5-methylcytosine-specific restriction endonuclease McrA
MGKQKKKKNKASRTLFLGASRYPRWETYNEGQRKFRINIERQKTQAIRKLLITEGFYACYYCGRIKKAEEMTIDHVIPLGKGGKTVFNNVRISCAKCNTKKGNTDILQEILEKKSQ